MVQINVARIFIVVKLVIHSVECVQSVAASHIISATVRRRRWPTALHLQSSIVTLKVFIQKETRELTNVMPLFQLLIKSLQLFKKFFIRKFFIKKFFIKKFFIKKFFIEKLI